MDFTNICQDLNGKILIFEYGKKGLIRSFRINGLRSDLERLIDTLINMGVKFDPMPYVEPVRNDLFSTVLNIVIEQ